MISVCLTTYNSEPYIAEQLHSILRQSHPVDEIIIVDDDSKDNTCSIINKINDSRIKVYKNEKNEGVIFSFQRAVSLAKGKHIYLSDHDDIWHDDKVKVIEGHFKKGFDLIVHNAVIIKKSANSSQWHEDKTLFDLRNSKTGFIKNCIKNSYIGCCMAFDANVRDAVLPVPAKADMHDVWIGLLCELMGYKIKFENRCLLYYRRHEYNASVDSRRSLCKIIAVRSILLYFIVKRLVLGI